MPGLNRIACQGPPPAATGAPSRRASRGSAWISAAVGHSTRSCETGATRSASRHIANLKAIELDVDILGNPQREDDDGLNWARLSDGRSVRSWRGTSKSMTTTRS